MVTELNREFYLQLAQPFAGDASTGVDVKGSDALEQLEEELANGEGLNISSIEWDKVERCAASILAEKSKDLKVTGYLVTALYEQYGFAGLATGFQLFGDMVNADYWPEIHPQRGKIKKQNKARASSFAWPIFRLDRLLQSYEVSEESDFEQLLSAAEAFAYADAALYDRLEDEAPDCSDARNRFKGMAQEAKAWLDETKRKTEPEPIEVKAPEPVKTVTQRVKDKAKEVVESVKEAFVPPGEPTICVSKADVDKALRSSGKTIGSVVSALRSADEHDPMSFFLSRTATWMTLDEVPPDGIMPPNPTEQQWAELAVMVKNQHHQALIETGEKLFRQGAVFNMDLQRLIANALDRAGAKEASHMVNICAAHLVQRLPGLMNAKFSNKQPFVDDLSKNWLDNTSVFGRALNGEKK